MRKIPGKVRELVDYWREFQNMFAGTLKWLPEEVRNAQRESWGRSCETKEGGTLKDPRS